MIKQYKKKPVVVEAMIFSADTWSDLVAFTKGLACDLRYHGQGPVTCTIPTLEGPHIATEGDFIIKGVKGEFYPCKPDIFEQTYDEV